MSYLVEFLLESLFEMIGGLLDAWFGPFDWPDTLASRIFLGVILAFLGGLIWWELR